jgi:hypothetical protein
MDAAVKMQLREIISENWDGPETETGIENQNSGLRAR